jgi:hypothetical protein
LAAERKAVTRPHRIVALVALGIAAACLEAGLWLAGLPVGIALVVQGLLALVVGGATVYLADVLR